MKKFLLIFIILFASSMVCWAAVDAFLGQTIAGGASPTYLLSESFDGSSACGDGSHTNCDVTWDSVTGSAIDFNYTTSPAPLEGTNSCLIDSDGSYDRIEESFGDQSGETWTYFQVRYTTLNATSDKAHFNLRDNADSATVAQLKFASNEKMRAYHGTSNAYTTTIFATGTTYHIWVRHTPGTGANGELDVYVAENSDTRPGSPEIDINDGDGNDEYGRMDILSYDGEFDFIIDKIRVDDAEIGSSPQ